METIIHVTNENGGNAMNLSKEQIDHFANHLCYKKSGAASCDLCKSF
jgi:hypothetical protein